MRSLRRAAGIVCAAAAFDLLVVIVTGGDSLVNAKPGREGFVVRLLVMAVAAWLRFRTWAEPTRRVSNARVLLLALLLPTLYQFEFAGGRMNGDGVYYYVFLRSILKDADVDLTNEYTYYGLITRGDYSMPTSTGLRRSIYAVGPGLMGIPGFLVGEIAARTQAALGREFDLTGYGPTHRNGVALGNLLYGFGALLLIHALLLRYFRDETALLATLAIWGTGFLHWYLVQQPMMSHGPSAFVGALAIFLWARWRDSLFGVRAAALGLLLGLAMCVRWQNGVLLLLPGVDLLRRFGRERWRAVLAATLLGAATLVGTVPQLLTWKAMYGQYLLHYPPQGTEFLRLDHPFFPETFFSSRHGLLSWTPAFWAGYLGCLPLLARRRAVAVALLPPLLVMSYVNACTGDWWGGGSFSNRRFDSVLPLLAFGFAASIDWTRRMLLARRSLALALVGVPIVAWNVALADATQRNLVPRDDTIAFARLVGSAASAFSDRVGFPTTWPASWWFAWREGLSPGRYDLAVGRYLLYRQNNLGGVIDTGNEEHASLLAEGWSRIQTVAGVRGRFVDGPARVLAPLDVPEALELRLQVYAPGDRADVQVRVNDCDAGRVRVTPGAWLEARVLAPAACWRRELNDVTFETTARIAVGAVRFVRGS